MHPLYFDFPFRSAAEEPALGGGTTFTQHLCYPPAMPATEYNFWVYIMASRSLQLYIGFTHNIRNRVAEHKELRPGTYTARYNITRLVHFEHYQYVLNAIARENELKDWNRQKKLDLLHQHNPTWLDLSEGWYDK